MNNDTSKFDDIDIIRRILEGEVDVFEKIISEYNGLVFKILSRHLPYQELEETAQEVFVRAYQSLPSFKNKSSFKFWLSSIAVRVCYNFWRKKYRNREVFVDFTEFPHGTTTNQEIAMVAENKTRLAPNTDGNMNPAQRTLPIRMNLLLHLAVKSLQKPRNNVRFACHLITRQVIFLFAICALFFSGSDVLAQVRPAQPNVESSGTALHRAKLGSANVQRTGNLFLGGQFAKKDIAAIQDHKITRIITFRTEDELDWNEKTSVKAAGIEFIEVPFRKPETLTDRVFDKTRELLRDKSQTTLIHCGSGNRAAGVWLTYRVLDEGVDLKTALAEAKDIGLRAKFIEEKAIDYIKRKQTPPKMGGESSVKPGINRAFVDPDLDVDAFVKRFEIESREVFLNRKRILAASGVKKGDTVADIGAGTGLFTRMFSTVVGDQGWVYAVEIAPRFIQHINAESIKHKMKNITGVLSAENSVNLPPKSVDIAFVCSTYHHFEYPQSTLSSIHRALKDDGYLIVIDYERIPGKSREWVLGHIRAGKEVYSAEIKNAGFTLAEEKKIEGFKENYFLKFRKK